MLTFKKATHPGRQITWNVSRTNGAPFGMIWTWPNTRTERHPFHAKPLNGYHRTFSSLMAAQQWIEKQAESPQEVAAQVYPHDEASRVALQQQLADE